MHRSKISGTKTGIEWCFSSIKKLKVFLLIFESNELGDVSEITLSESDLDKLKTEVIGEITELAEDSIKPDEPVVSDLIDVSENEEDVEVENHINFLLKLHKNRGIFPHFVYRNDEHFHRIPEERRATSIPV